jgi:hypothetical protein
LATVNKNTSFEACTGVDKVYFMTQFNTEVKKIGATVDILNTTKTGSEGTETDILTACRFIGKH